MQRNVHFGLRGLDRNFANGCVWMHTAKTTPNQNRPKSSELSISLSLSHSFLVCMMRRTPTTWLIFHHQWSLLSEEYRFLVFCLHSLFIWRDRVGACLNSRKQQQSHHRKHAHTAEPGDNRVAVADRWSPSHGYGWAFSVYENWYLFVVYMRVSARAHVYLTCVNVCLLMDCWLLVRCNSFFFRRFVASQGLFCNISLFCLVSYVCADAGCSMCPFSVLSICRLDRNLGKV